MPKRLRTLRTSLAVTIALGAATSAHGQSGPNIGGIFGAILNSPVADQARREWQNRPVAEYNCLAAHNMSAAQLAASGIGPTDLRVQRILSQCAREASPVGGGKVSPVTTTTTGPHNRDFAVDGLAVGAAVYPDSAAYKAYTCRPSDQFPGFKWCTTRHPMIGKFGPYDSSLTILHSDANLVVFVLQDVLPAHFAVGDTEQEIQRLSQRFGQSAHVLHGDPRPEAPNSIIASWGDVTLTPLDDATMDALRGGETITAGLLIDYLGDAKKSAQEGLPVFHMGGGAGYIWAAKFDDSGRGRLRITAVNSSLLPASPVEQPPSNASTAAATDKRLFLNPIPDAPVVTPTPSPQAPGRAPTQLYLNPLDEPVVTPPSPNPATAALRSEELTKAQGGDTPNESPRGTLEFPQGTITAGPQLGQGNEAYPSTLAPTDPRYVPPTQPKYTRESPEIVTPDSIKAEMAKGKDIAGPGLKGSPSFGNLERITRESVRQAGWPFLTCTLVGIVGLMARHPEAIGHPGLWQKAADDEGIDHFCDAEEAEFRRIDGDDVVDATADNLQGLLGFSMAFIIDGLKEGTVKLEGFK
jgi:hypothetical protein